MSIVDDGDARRMVIRLDVENEGRGQTHPVAIELESPAGNTATAGFTLVEAESINIHGGGIDLTEDQILDELLAGLYEKFGDFNHYVRDGVDLYALDYASLDLDIDSHGFHIYAKAKADLVEDPMVTLLGLEDEEELDETVEAVVEELRELVEGLPRQRRRSDADIREAARITVRRAIKSWTGKKPLTQVHLIRV